MTKKRSINIIILLSIVLVIGILASFVSFTYPFSINGNYYSYSSFVNELVLGADISDGVAITYRAEMPEGESESNYDVYMNNTILGLQDILSSAGYKDSNVSRLGDNQIYVNVGNINDYEDQQEVISLIGDPQKLKFSSSSDSTTAGEFDFSGKYVKNVEVKTQEGNGMSYYYVDIQLDSTGTDLLKTLTESIVKDSGSLYIYLGKNAISNYTLDEVIKDGHITMFSEENFVDKQTTQAYVNSIKTGLLDLDLQQLESSKISASYGKNTIIMLGIGMICLVIASFVFLAIKYKQLGLMAIFNMLFFIVIGLGLLQSIPFIHINMSGWLAIGLCYILAVASIVSICENAKAEYATGKKLHTSLKLAQKKSLVEILVSSVFMFVAGVVCALVPQMAVQSFGMVALTLSLVNIFSSLALFRLMIKLYTGLNAFKGEKCNFKLEEDARNDK